MTRRSEPPPLPTDRPAVRTLTESDVELATQVIVRAFWDDPGSVFLVPVEADRARLLAPFFERAVQTCLSRGVALGTVGPDGLDAVLLGTPPGPVAQVEEGAPAPTAASEAEPSDDGGLAARTAPFFEAMHDLIETALPASVWYLDFLATDPSVQERGRASALVQSFHELVDAEGGQVGLLTFTRPNVAYYERRGYRTIDERAFVPGGFTMWAMTRKGS